MKGPGEEPDATHKEAGFPWISYFLLKEKIVPTRQLPWDEDIAMKFARAHEKAGLKDKADQALEDAYKAELEDRARRAREEVYRQEAQRR